MIKIAIYNLNIQPDNNVSPLKKYQNMIKQYGDFFYLENMNLPKFANNNAEKFWKSDEIYESKNANLFMMIEFSLPYELNNDENINIASKFGKILFGKKYVYSLAIHSKPSEDPKKMNAYCRIMFCERELDGIERNEIQFFKRANAKNPSLGGAKKNREWRKYSKYYFIRQTWEKILNEKLKEKGVDLVSCKSLKVQRLEAIAEGNFLKAELLDREPINLKKNYIKFAKESDEKNKKIKFFEYCKQIREIKEKDFEEKSKNFEEENRKARDRYYKKLNKK